MPTNATALDTSISVNSWLPSSPTVALSAASRASPAAAPAAWNDGASHSPSALCPPSACGIPTYPAKTEPGGRLLLGFSKSGWGTFSLLLRLFVAMMSGHILMEVFGSFIVNGFGSGSPGYVFIPAVMR